MLRGQPTVQSERCGAGVQDVTHVGSRPGQTTLPVVHVKVIFGLRVHIAVHAAVRSTRLHLVEQRCSLGLDFVIKLQGISADISAKQSVTLTFPPAVTASTSSPS